ncbi:MAG: hypothetical protein IAG13_21890 [Deltaproteobacteria bacterium]|nr:hypothetical protein [Nannocystaceae bacterium]
MHCRALVLALAWLGVAHGCGMGSFTCEDALDCKHGAVLGTCEPDGGCSFTDEACASGRRYGEHSPGDRAGRCVEVVAGSDSGGDSSPGSSSGPGSTSSATTSDPIGSSSEADASTTAGAASSSETGPASTDTGPSESTGATPPSVFFDAFDRADADALGNGWVENNEGSFQIVDEQVVLGTSNGNDFRTNACHRPPEESLLDVEVSAEIVFYAEEYAGFPQLHLRIQPESFGPDNPLDAYVVYLDSTSRDIPPYLSVVRIIDASFGDETQAPLVPFPGNQYRYRLRARVSGIDPVLVEGYFEIELDDGWEVLNEASLLDTAEQRIATAGMVGFSGHAELEQFALDEFGYTELAP